MTNNSAMIVGDGSRRSEQELMLERGGLSSTTHLKCLANVEQITNTLQLRKALFIRRVREERNGKCCAHPRCGLCAVRVNTSAYFAARTATQRGV